MGMISVVASIAKKAEKIGADFPDDFAVDGLRYCGKCRTPKQCRIEIGGEKMVVRCLCTCEKQESEKKREIMAAEEKRMRIDALRARGILDGSLRDFRFDAATDTPLLRKCLRYAEHWERAEEENLGLLLWGPPGGGKTFAAACIANALIDRGIRSMFTSFPRLLAASWEERGEFLRNASRFPLLVIDDFGAERNTDFSVETVYTVIDERYKNNRPLIVTTNLPLRSLQEPERMEYKRIYDRVLEMCAPVFVEAATFRKDVADRKLRSAKEIFGK